MFSLSGIFLLHVDAELAFNREYGPVSGFLEELL